MAEEIKKEEDKEKETPLTPLTPDLVINPIIDEEEANKIPFMDMLSKLSPGKPLRTALDDILGAGDGTLVVIDCPKLKEISEGGFRVNCNFTPQRLTELSKMDGAIILSSDLKRILFANVLLVPDTRIPSNETGTRHKAAERASIQLEIPAIAVSERRKKITLFYDSKKYLLQDSEILLRRATENLHILEKQREIFNELITNLNILETTNLVSIGDVCSVLQRIEIITRIMTTLKRYIIELGKEGVIIQMRVRELFKGVEELEKLVLRDYADKPANIKTIISSLNFDGILDTDTLARLLFESSLDKQIYPKGYRLLNKLDLVEGEIDSLVGYFKNLGNLLNATEEELKQLLKNRTENFKKEFEELREQIMMGKKI